VTGRAATVQEAMREAFRAGHEGGQDHGADRYLEGSEDEIREAFERWRDVRRRRGAAVKGGSRRGAILRKQPGTTGTKSAFFGRPDACPWPTVINRDRGWILHTREDPGSKPGAPIKEVRGLQAVLV
jgi:hypothetical protein